jgi:hypothetical protein
MEPSPNPREFSAFGRDRDLVSMSSPTQDARSCTHSGTIVVT